MSISVNKFAGVACIFGALFYVAAGGNSLPKPTPGPVVSPPAVGVDPHAKTGGIVPGTAAGLSSRLPPLTNTAIASALADISVTLDDLSKRLDQGSQDLELCVYIGALREQIKKLHLVSLSAQKGGPSNGAVSIMDYREGLVSFCIPTSNKSADPLYMSVGDKSALRQQIATLTNQLLGFASNYVEQ